MTRTSSRSTAKTPQRADEVAELCRKLRVGDPKIYHDIGSMVQDPEVDAVWVVGTNDRRVEMIETICEEVASGRATLRGIACEKPLGRNVAEAKRITECVEQAGLLNGYLENQVFCPALVKGREIIWRRGRGHQRGAAPCPLRRRAFGPPPPVVLARGAPGGGVLNDMMCHSVEAGRFLLSYPDVGYDWLKPKAVTARIASLKWSRPAIRQAPPGRDGPRGRLPPTSGRRLRDGRDRLRDARRRPRGRPGQHFVVLCRRGAAAHL